ncbi:MAG: TlpA disulfide reductase family protein [Bacteroidia bacterium]|nr:TlpA disulfide reductase family protein [Bacteroidia bacterium]
MKKIHLFPVVLAAWLLCLSSCQSPSSTPITLQNGNWVGTLHLREAADLPFQFSLNQAGENYKMVVFNAEERIEVDEIVQKGDSLIIKMPVFDSEFKLKIHSATELSGNWYDYTRGVDYHTPFKAEFGEEGRFPIQYEAAELAPLYSLQFLDGTGPAIGQFSQNGNKVTGNFQTETGDYRFLEGIMDGNTLKLSAFDGSHAFLFHADIKGDSIAGKFWSGSHWEESWIGIVDPGASIRKPEDLTFLKEGFEEFSFKFPNLEGDSISFKDDRFKNKVTIVQLMGSWCPNCMDETRLFTQWYDKYHKEGLEIVGVAFERTSKGMPQAQKNIVRMAKRLEANYPFLLAATNNDKSLASEKFPMLNNIISFPTSIFLDKKGRVRKVHTGFNGPGTGNVYTRYVEEYEAFLEKMLAEEI